MINTFTDEHNIQNLCRSLCFSLFPFLTGGVSQTPRLPQLRLRAPWEPSQRQGGGVIGLQACPMPEREEKRENTDRETLRGRVGTKTTQTKKSTITTHNKRKKRKKKGRKKKSSSFHLLNFFEAASTHLHGVQELQRLECKR